MSAVGGAPRVVALADLATRLHASPPRAGSRRVLAVDGRAGAGKSTLAERLGALLPAPVVAMDELYPGWDGLDAAVPALVAEVLRPLAEGRTAAYRRWDWIADRWGETRSVPDSPSLVVEGVGAGSRLAAPYLSLLIWVEAPAAVRRGRALDRDGDGFRPHWDRWARQEEALLSRERTPERADVVVDADPRVPYDAETEVVITRG